MPRLLGVIDEPRQSARPHDRRPVRSPRRQRRKPRPLDPGASIFASAAQSWPGALDNGSATLKRLPPKVLGLPHPLLEVGELSAVVGKLGTGQDLLLEKLARPSPIVFGVLVQYGNWQAPFIVAACLLLGGACIWAFWLWKGANRRPRTSSRRIKHRRFDASPSFARDHRRQHPGRSSHWT